MSHLLVIGSLAYDSVETPSGKADRALGGSANYFSLSASQFAKVRVVGVVGEDYLESDKELLKARGVDLTGMTQVPGKTFHWKGKYEGDLNEAQTLQTDLNVFEHFNPQLPEAYKSTEFIFLANIVPELQLQVLADCKNPTYVGLDTMNFWISSKRESLLKVISKVNIVLINEKEATMLTDAGNAIEAAPKICELGPEAVIIKRGEYGSVLYAKDGGYFMLPSYPITKVVDPTGAGDTFAGGVFGYLTSLGKRPTFQDLKQACVRGTVLASFTIQDFSVKRLASLNTADFSKRAEEFQKIITL